MIKRKLIPILLLFSLLLSFVVGCTRQEITPSEQSGLSVSDDDTSIETDESEEDAVTSATSQDNEEDKPTEQEDSSLKENGAYSSKEDVALYLHNFKKLPPNFITKGEAKKSGWIAKDGNLWEVTDRMSIGGDIFQNREGKLPSAESRIWYECDIDYEGGTRGPKRIVYSNDGWIYYTGDHYSTFELLYEGD
ncbi:MAG: ribonuclease domain-containing protein [Filifactor alocis]|nr:ribonuclease domain-containing protein [Filifactor alocis]